MMNLMENIPKRDGLLYKWQGRRGLGMSYGERGEVNTF